MTSRNVTRLHNRPQFPLELGRRRWTPSLPRRLLSLSLPPFDYSRVIYRANDVLKYYREFRRGVRPRHRRESTWAAFPLPPSFSPSLLASFSPFSSLVGLEMLSPFFIIGPVSLNFSLVFFFFSFSFLVLRSFGHVYFSARWCIFFSSFHYFFIISSSTKASTILSNLIAIKLEFFASIHFRSPRLRDIVVALSPFSSSFPR